ncbi:uncharacterized protein [Physcomitrium patens]|uniref:uncharacterized protein isoform X3 n=1 Tax=Physcomitrium patens TaxID=3218 RepID=UPI000D16B5AF|nr:uncharacterized protein LOC112277100 isoform X4 [Physcomitrium patens]|eukprot:XP_024364828.1 uncharacterized protein LOC112277100 isoform X4 [Physcomitrella patens]
MECCNSTDATSPLSSTQHAVFASALAAARAISSPSTQSVRKAARKLLFRARADAGVEIHAPLFLDVVTAPALAQIKLESNVNKMTGGPHRMLAFLGLLSSLSFLLISPVDAQNSMCSQCHPHARCYCSTFSGRCDCSCVGYYTGDGITCRYSTWRVVLYVLSSVIAFLLIFFLCWTCLKYLRRRRDAPVDYPMQPMGYPPYGYPQPTQPQSTANPAMYSYPPQNGYPVNGYPAQMDNQQHPPPPSSKVPGPSGTV